MFNYLILLLITVLLVGCIYCCSFIRFKVLLSWLNIALFNLAKFGFIMIGALFIYHLVSYFTDSLSWLYCAESVPRIGDDLNAADRAIQPSRQVDGNPDAISDWKRFGRMCGDIGYFGGTVWQHTKPIVTELLDNHTSVCITSMAMSSVWNWLPKSPYLARAVVSGAGGGAAGVVWHVGVNHGSTLFPALLPNNWPFPNYLASNENTTVNFNPRTRPLSSKSWSLTKNSISDYDLNRNSDGDSRLHPDS